MSGCWFRWVCFHFALWRPACSAEVRAINFLLVQCLLTVNSCHVSIRLLLTHRQRQMLQDTIGHAQTVTWTHSHTPVVIIHKHICTIIRQTPRRSWRKAFSSQPHADVWCFACWTEWYFHKQNKSGCHQCVLFVFLPWYLYICGIDQYWYIRLVSTSLCLFYRHHMEKSKSAFPQQPLCWCRHLFFCFHLSLWK